MSLDPFTAGFDLIRTGLDKIFPDANEELKGKLAQAASEINNEYQLAMGQIDINKIEASNTNWLVSGWRPAVGWICGVALAYSAIIEPIARFIATVIFAYHGVFPIIDTTITLQVLLGMLGFGGLRSFEKHLETKVK